MSLRTSAVRATRPRLLSYAGRWGRARRWLPTDAGLVLDVGSAFGYGTAALAARRAQRTIGIERDPTHLAAATTRFPWLWLVRATSDTLPFRTGAADAVTLLDVVEHVFDPAATLAEVHRVLRPGGVLVLSVPHRGALEPLDSLNVYPRIRRTGWPPLDAADDCDGGRHRHFSLAELNDLLGPGFVVDKVALTGLGAAEVFHLAALIGVRGVLGREGAYQALLLVHLLVYLVDDLVRLGRVSYYLTVRARAVDPREVVA